jgi:hypothetical protein
VPVPSGEHVKAAAPRSSHGRERAVVVASGRFLSPPLAVRREIHPLDAGCTRSTSRVLAIQHSELKRSELQ